MKRFLILLIGVTLCLVFVGEAVDIRYKVSVSVSCKNENTKTFIESHIKRELRSLSDVDIMNRGDARHHIDLVVVEMTRGQEKHKTGGIAIAVNFLQRAYLSDDFRSKTHPNVKASDIYRGLFYLTPRLILYVGDTEDLDDRCKDIIVDFDSEVLEPARGFRRDLLGR